ncbi:NAD-dependent epimerase/dehydratase family protein [Anoxynatronum sibiricum]|uniref:NAD-dependent epimerase/dehydratase family protein n=1 Tax=Anoxynatronum sibiricum TaxID=210623 RepID=A0ABU9VUD7_9CLOT
MSLGFSNSTILVVGGAGFVGSNLCHFLLEDENVAALIIVDNLLSSDMCNLPDDPRVTFLHGSITDNRILSHLPRDIQYVFHLACYHGNQSSIADPFADHENNTLTSLKLFDTLKDFPSLRKVVYAAAGCAVAEKTFDEAKSTTEEAPVSLYHDSPYSISKLIGELYGNYYFQHYGLPLVKARFQNVYGPREILGAGRWRGTAHTVWRNVVPTFVWKSLHSEALPLDNGGNASRDFIFVEDMARGLIACALKGEPGEVYNLASGEETTIWDLAHMINELAGNKTPVDLLPPRDWDRSGKRFGSTEKAKEKLGFKTQISIPEGLEKTLLWTIREKEHILRTMRTHSYFVPEVDKYITDRSKRGEADDR